MTRPSSEWADIAQAYRPFCEQTGFLNFDVLRSVRLLSRAGPGFPIWVVSVIVLALISPPINNPNTSSQPRDMERECDSCQVRLNGSCFSIENDASAGSIACDASPCMCRLYLLSGMIAQSWPTVRLSRAHGGEASQSVAASLLWVGLYVNIFDSIFYDLLHFLHVFRP